LNNKLFESVLPSSGQWLSICQKAVSKRVKQRVNNVHGQMPCMSKLILLA